MFRELRVRIANQVCRLEKKKSPTHLWLIERREGNTVGYDETRAFVIRAVSEKRAREIAAANRSDEMPVLWLDSEQSTCKILQRFGDEGVILQDVR